MTFTSTPEQISSLLAGPAGPPPPGVTPQFEGAPNIQVVGRAWVTVGLLIMILIMSMRLYAQWFMTKVYVVEDFLVSLAAALFIAFFAVGYLSQTSDYSNGYHMWDRTVAIFIKTQKVNAVGEILYIPAYALVKIGILLQLRRTFSPTRGANPWLRWGCFIWIALIVIFYTIVSLLDIFQCSTIRKAWDPWNPLIPGTCGINIAAVLLCTAVFNMISDFLILALPLPAIWALHMKLKEKLLIGALFATGGLACVTSIIRLYYSVLLVNDTDSSWLYVGLGIAAFFEGVIGMVVFSLPVAPKFFQTIQTKIYYSKVKRTTGQDSEQDQNGGVQQMHQVERNFGAPRRQHHDFDLGLSSVDKYLGPQSRQDSIYTPRMSASRGENSPSEVSLSRVDESRLGNLVPPHELV